MNTSQGLGVSCAAAWRAGGMLMLWLLMSLGLSACTAPGGGAPPEADAAQRVIDAPPELVAAQGAVILRREFGRLLRDSAPRLESVPQEYVTDSASGAARDLYRGRSRMRQSAVMTVARGGATAACVARLRVVIEREDSGREQAMAPATARLGDTPGSQTAIAQDAATSAAQNTVWTRVRRNYSLERRLLDELAEHFARISALEPAAAPALPTSDGLPSLAPRDVGDATPHSAVAPAIPEERLAFPEDQPLVVPAREVP